MGVSYRVATTSEIVETGTWDMADGCHTAPTGYRVGSDLCDSNASRWVARFPLSTWNAKDKVAHYPPPGSHTG
jgi:hypothetical protein